MPSKNISLTAKILLEYLDKGIENTKTREQCCAFLHMNDRGIRELIQELKHNGYVVCSSSSRVGYFVPRMDRTEEVEIAKSDYEERKQKALTMLGEMSTMKAWLSCVDEQVRTEQPLLFSI